MKLYMRRFAWAGWMAITLPGHWTEPWFWISAVVMVGLVEMAIATEPEWQLRIALAVAERERRDLSAWNEEAERISALTRATGDPDA